MDKQTFLIEGIIGLDILPSQVSEFLNSANGLPVKFQINSPGGFVFDAIAIHNLILQYSAPVEIEILALCASSASFISTAGDKVTVFPDSVYMLHNAWLFSYGDHNKLREDADHIEKISNLLLQSYAEFSGKSPSEIQSLMDAETFLFGKEIVDHGFAHELITETGYKPITQSNTNDSVFDGSHTAYSQVPSSDSFYIDDYNTAVDYSKKVIQSAFDKMSSLKSLTQDIQSAYAFISSLTKYDFRQKSDTLVKTSDRSHTAYIPSVAEDAADEGSHTAYLPDSQLSLLSRNLFEKLSFIQNSIDQINSILSNVSSITAETSAIRSMTSVNDGSHTAYVIDINFFEYRLNALVNAKMILPAHKELILKVISFLNEKTFNSIDTDSKSDEHLFNLFEKLISLPSAVLSASSEPSGLTLDKPYDFHNSSDQKSQFYNNLDNTITTYESFDLPVDPVSRTQHLAVLEIMNQFNCDYISAYNIYFNQLNK